MKKFISILCITSILLGVSTNSFSAEGKWVGDIYLSENEEIVGDFIYYNLGDKKIIVGYIGNSTECVLPENSIVEGIGNYVPVGKVIISGNVEIKNSLAPADNNIREVEFTKPITEIPANLCNGLQKLERVTFAPKTEIKQIGYGAFAYCSSLKEIDLWDNLEVIRGNAFKGSGILGELILPETLTEIGDNAFAGCGPFNKVHLPDGLKKYDIYNWFSGTPITEMNIPDSVIKNPSLLDSMSSFGYSEITFNGDMTLDIYDLVHGSKWCTENYLKGKTDKTIKFTDGFAILDSTVLQYQGTDKNPAVPDGITQIYKEAFHRCKIDTVTLPKSLEKIGNLAFSMSSLQKITIPANVKEIGEAAFHDCTLLKELIFEGAPKLNYGIIEGCTSLNNGTITFKDSSINLPEDFYNFRQSTYIEEYQPWNEDISSTPVPTPKTTDSPAPTPSTKPNETPKPDSSPKPEQTPLPTPEPEQMPVMAVTSANGEVKVWVNDKEIVFPDAKPFIDENSRTQIPVRAVAEALGCEVDYDGETQLVTVTDKENIITLTIGSRTLTKNGTASQMDTEAIISSDRTYIPARFIAEALGYKVEWR